jgi:hypothetical protein
LREATGLSELVRDDGEFVAIFELAAAGKDSEVCAANRLKTVWRSAWCGNSWQF